MGPPQILICAGEEVPRMALRVLQATHRTFGGNGRTCHLAERYGLCNPFAVIIVPLRLRTRSLVVLSHSLAILGPFTDQEADRKEQIYDIIEKKSYIMKHNLIEAHEGQFE